MAGVGGSVRQHVESVYNATLRWMTPAFLWISMMSVTTTPADSHEGDQHNDIGARALAINLANNIYGTFAEIGAGQEVARWFLRVGAASGTVAKTISAYDKT